MVRGAKFEDIKKYKNDVRDKKIFCNLGGVVPVPADIIYNHFRIIGAQGTGKTQTIVRMRRPMRTLLKTNGSHLFILILFFLKIKNFLAH